MTLSRQTSSTPDSDLPGRTAQLESRAGLKQQVASELRWSSRVSTWVFVAASLMMVGWAGWTQLVNPDGAVRLLSVADGGVLHEAWGLTYVGAFGAFLALLQLAVVSGASACSLAPMTNVRRAGHVVLVGWAALWLGNLIWLTSESGSMSFGFSTVIVGVLTLGTMVRAMMNWNRKNKNAGRPPYKERIDRLSSYAQDLFSVDEEAREADRLRRAEEGMPIQRAGARARDAGVAAARRSAGVVASSVRKVKSAVQKKRAAKKEAAQESVASASMADAAEATQEFEPVVTRSRGVGSSLRRGVKRMPWSKWRSRARSVGARGVQMSARAGRSAWNWLMARDEQAKQTA